jgi:hypothetical protein
MKLKLLLVVSLMIVNIAAKAQDVRLEGAHHGHELPPSTSPDGLWTVRHIYHDGKFVSNEWIPWDVKPAFAPIPGRHWNVVPVDGQPGTYTWTGVVVPDPSVPVQPPAPPQPPQPPAPPKPIPAPVPPVLPTPQCDPAPVCPVVYYPVYVQPTPYYAPVSWSTWQYGHTARSGGCGLLRRIFGRCR